MSSQQELIAELEKATSAFAHAMGRFEDAIDALPADVARNNISVKAPAAIDAFAKKVRDLMGDLAS